MLPADQILGFAAACCVLLTFCMKTMRSLRTIALLSNVLFIAYAYRLDLAPVLTLHLLLVPINLLGLCREVGADSVCRNAAKSSE